MNSRIYLDNAATTSLHPEVAAAMMEVMQNDFGNPSSLHAHGRKVRSLIEDARKSVAKILNCAPGEIFFTSGGTEADNMALRKSVDDLNITHVISSPIEHHAVLHTLEELHHAGKIQLHMVRLLENTHIDLKHLEDLLAGNPGALVSLMHANNELGTMIDIQTIAELCKKYQAWFQSDTVQTLGHIPLDLKQTPVDFITCGAHKFHGPKGVGFIYISNRVKIHPFLTGGSQERNMRGGTENVYGIVGLSKALELATAGLEKDKLYISGLKQYMMEQLLKHIPGVRFNGDTSERSLYTVLNVCFPPSEFSEMLLFKLDIEGVSCSGGSACSSGSQAGSHVLAAIGLPEDCSSVRFSFSKYNTREEIDRVVNILGEMFVK